MFPKRLPIHDPESGVEHVLYIYMTHFKQMYGMLELVLFDFSGVKQVFIDRVYQESSCRVLTDEEQIIQHSLHQISIKGQLRGSVWERDEQTRLSEETQVI